ncbi:histone deacetylase family protein [Thermosulfuriphilus sp.]
MLKVVYSPFYAMDWGEHVFPAEKYPLLFRRLQEERKGLVVLEPKAPSWEDLSLVHDPAYLEDLKTLRLSPRTAFSEIPLNVSMVEGSRIMCGGTLLTAKLALEEGLGFHLGGGLHHAYPDHAEGFCYLNDLAFAVACLKKEGLIKRAAVVDLDLHQGNGTAFFFSNDPSVFTFSIHQERLYPWPKEKSDLDIGLEAGTTDEEYLLILESGLGRVLEHDPELVLYQAGVDPYLDDPLGDLALSEEGLRRRDELVLEELAMAGIPVAITLGGGYSRPADTVVELHLQTFKVAERILQEFYS